MLSKTMVEHEEALALALAAELKVQVVEEEDERVVFVHLARFAMEEGAADAAAHSASTETIAVRIFVVKERQYLVNRQRIVKYRD